MIVFIVISTMIFLNYGKPISLLIIAGAINGWILPITLGAILIASKKKSIVGDYKHPNWMFIFWYRCSTCYNIDRYILIQRSTSVILKDISTNSITVNVVSIRPKCVLIQ